MALENGHCFTRITNQNCTAILVDAEDAVRVLFEMKVELKTIIEKLKPQITQDKSIPKSIGKRCQIRLLIMKALQKLLR